MSKWINKDLFDSFQTAKKEEAEKPSEFGGVSRRELIWPTPEKGTAEKQKVYEGRFVPDLKGNFYKKYFYHMFQVGEGNWYFIFCPKTHDFTNFCPWCSVVSHLYKGSAADKRAAGSYKRKERLYVIGTL